MNPLASALDVVCTRLRDRGLSAAVGVPAAGADLALWPWRLVELPGLRNAAFARNASGARRAGAAPLELHFLLVCNGSVDAVSALADAHAVLRDTPILQLGDARCELVSQSVAPADLAALFAAAGIRLTLASAWAVRSLGAPTP